MLFMMLLLLLLLFFALAVAVAGVFLVLLSFLWGRLWIRTTLNIAVLFKVFKTAVCFFLVSVAVAADAAGCCCFCCCCCFCFCCCCCCYGYRHLCLRFDHDRVAGLKSHSPNVEGCDAHCNHVVFFFATRSKRDSCRRGLNKQTIAGGAMIVREFCILVDHICGR